MSSAYNLVMKTNPTAPFALGAFGLAPGDFPRWRDAWLSDDGTLAHILTRAGYFDASDDDDDATGEKVLKFRKHASYLYDTIDEFDSTFRVFTFTVPERCQPDLKVIANVVRLTGRGEDRNGPKMISAAMAGNLRVDGTITEDSIELIEMAESMGNLITIFEDMYPAGKA